jgi:hypothetical protein
MKLPIYRRLWHLRCRIISASLMRDYLAQGAGEGWERECEGVSTCQNSKFLVSIFGFRDFLFRHIHFRAFYSNFVFIHTSFKIWEKMSLYIYIESSAVIALNFICINVVHSVILIHMLLISDIHSPSLNKWMTITDDMKILIPTCSNSILSRIFVHFLCITFISNFFNTIIGTIFSVHGFFFFLSRW